MRNSILKLLVEKVHALTFSYKAIHLNYFERELNAYSDMIAKHAVDVP